MKADLMNSWIMMCLLPNVVRDEHIDKYVACLLGDEMATDEEFAGMAYTGCSHVCENGCRFLYDGQCFHPFRPGSVFGAIFATAFRHEAAKDLVRESNVKALDSRDRRCHGCCCLRIPGFREIEDSAFACVERFYDELIECASKHKTLWSRSYGAFRNAYARGIDSKGYFLDCSSLKDYEQNVRRHFDRMMEYHFKIVEDAIAEDAKSPIDKGGKSELGKSLMKLRFDLVTHGMNYWGAEGYKEEDWHV